MSKKATSWTYSAYVLNAAKRSENEPTHSNKEMFFYITNENDYHYR
jgi:hypothetical protein